MTQVSELGERWMKLQALDRLLPTLKRHRQQKLLDRLAVKGMDGTIGQPSPELAHDMSDDDMIVAGDVHITEQAPQSAPPPSGSTLGTVAKFLIGAAAGAGGLGLIPILWGMLPSGETQPPAAVQPDTDTQYDISAQGDWQPPGG